MDCRLFLNNSFLNTSNINFVCSKTVSIYFRNLLNFLNNDVKDESILVHISSGFIPVSFHCDFVGKCGMAPEDVLSSYLLLFMVKHKSVRNYGCIIV